MSDTTFDFNGRHSDSPTEMRRYLWSLQPNGAVPGPRERTEADEKYRQFVREHYGVKFLGDEELSQG